MEKLCGSMAASFGSEVVPSVFSFARVTSGAGFVIEVCSVCTGTRMSGVSVGVLDDISMVESGLTGLVSRVWVVGIECVFAGEWVKFDEVKLALNECIPVKDSIDESVTCLVSDVMRGTAVRRSRRKGSVGLRAIACSK